MAAQTSNIHVMAGDHVTVSVTDGDSAGAHTFRWLKLIVHERPKAMLGAEVVIFVDDLARLKSLIDAAFAAPGRSCTDQFNPPVAVHGDVDATAVSVVGQ